MKIVRRTFEVAKHPPLSKERAQLNLHSLTSEYMPSYRYVILDDAGKTVVCARTRREAESLAK